jgi:D-aminoacyl-tRNA deacylase
MRAVIQRVKKAIVKVDGVITGEIGDGLLAMIAIKVDDNLEEIKWFANKLVNLRVFSDVDGKMNLSVLDINGGILLISNFTVYGDVKKGFRPNFMKSASANISEPIYKNLVDFMRKNYPIKIANGIFGAMMDVDLINDGPVTLIIERE